MENRSYWNALYEVKDPEIPTISVVEMGMVNRVLREGNKVFVEMTPTFVGCPALDMIKDDVKKRLMKEDGVEEVVVEFVYSPQWTSSRITEEGHKRLKEFGIAPPAKGTEFSVPPCPYCNATEGSVESLFGPTACRAIFYCKSCHQPFEGMKVI